MNNFNKFDMALWTGFMTPEDEEHFFIEADISTNLAKNHATKFADVKLMIESLQMLDRPMLKELGVILMGEALCILRLAKEATTLATRVQALVAKPPHLNLEVNPQQFRKFSRQLCLLYNWILVWTTSYIRLCFPLAMSK